MAKKKEFTPDQILEATKQMPLIELLKVYNGTATQISERAKAETERIAQATENLDLIKSGGTKS